MRQLAHGGNTNIALTSLHAADIVSMEVGSFRQRTVRYQPILLVKDSIYAFN